MGTTDTSFLAAVPMVGTSGLEPPTSRLSGVRSNHLSYAPMSSGGGDEEVRTPDPLRARQVLSQLSYTPTALSASEGSTLKIEQHSAPKTQNPRLTRVPKQLPLPLCSLERR